MIYKRDLDFGFKMENDLFDTIKNKYGENICKTEPNCRVDYCDDNTLIELKSRRNNYNTYPTTMISKSKIDYMLNSGKRSICLFNFTDGLYSIEIDKNKIDNFELKKGGRRDRGKVEVNQYYYIPIELLTEM
jgi:hypothetical protein